MSTALNRAVGVSVLCLVTGSVFAQVSPPANLRCEYLTEPTCIGAAHPRFSWESRDGRRGAKQTAYEVHVATTRESALSTAPDVWSSGKVESSASFGIEYAGPELKSGVRYTWTVRTWDGEGTPVSWSIPATFSMGLLHEGDWQAKWIGDATPPPEARASRNGFHTQFAGTPETEKWVMIDLGQANSLDSVKLFPARPFDAKDTPGFCFPVRYKVIVSDSAEFKDAKVVADRSGDDAPASSEAVSIPFDGGAVKARYVRVVATKLREARDKKFALALAEAQAIGGGKVVSEGAKVTASDAIEDRNWSAKFLTDGDLVSHGATGWEALPAPMFRKEFTVAGEVKRATLYISALGLYEARLNGSKVGDHQLAPEWTDYTKRTQYQAYDLTGKIKKGANALGVTLGDGWYAGRLGMAQSFTPDHRPRAVYGRQPRLLAQLELQLADGTMQRVVTDGEWMSTVDGPIRSSDLLDGETYDASREVPGWDKAGYVVAAGGPNWKAAKVDDAVKVQLMPQVNEPIHAREEIRPIAMTEPTPGVYVFDMGQNMPGRCRIRVRGQPGAVVTMRHAEALNDDGTIYVTNLRGAPQIDRYTIRGDQNEVWEPKFTYHGFRFVEISGEIHRPTNSSVVGVVVCSDPEVVSTFSCSSPMLERLWKNILWTQHANMMSVPTDCPQRDERLGWMGDILAFAQNACFNKDMAAFFAKWSLDVRDAQADDGRFPDVAPHPYGKNERFTGVPAWGDAGVFVPWTSYLNYGDTRLIAEHFDAAKRWIDWIDSKNPDHLWKNNRHNDYNDWLNGDTLIAEGWPRKGAAIPNEVFATAFFARSTWIVSEMARVLGKEAEQKKYAKLAEDIRAAFNMAYVGSDGRMPGDTQAGYALALGFDLVPAEKRPEMVDHLSRGIENYKNHLSTGFHSSHHAMIELSKAGKNDLAYTLVNNTTFPSWGYSIENGATTIWERWDGYVKGRGFQDPGMNSLNHWALGSVGEWMMRTIVGINPGSPGWTRFTLRPVPGGGLKQAKGTFHSPMGKIESGWRTGGDATVFDFRVPGNTTAEVWLPAADVSKVTEGGKPLEGRVDIKKLAAERAAAGWVGLEVGSGVYSFRVGR